MSYLRLIALAPLLMGGCAASGLDQHVAQKWAFPATAPSPDSESPADAIAAASSGAIAPSPFSPNRPASETIAYQSDDEETGVLAPLRPESLKRAALSTVGLGPNAEAAKKLYLDAERTFLEAAAEADSAKRRKGYLSAAKQYTQAGNRWPGSALEEDAMLMVADSYFFADEYPEANTAYQGLIKKYPQTRHLDQVQGRRFRIAHFWLKLAETEHPLAINLTNDHKPWRDSRGAAIRILDRIRIDDPAGRLADDATMAAANAYFAVERYMEADDFYTDLRDTFLDSEHQFMAHFLGVQAKLRSYQGPDYGGNALDEAEKLIDKMRRQFPDQVGQYAEQLKEMYGQVRLLKAQRDVTTARFYDRRQEFGAARYYYDAVARNYTDTSLGTQASQRLAAIDDKPATPTKRLAWLAKAFPDREDRPLIVDQPGVYRR